MKILFMAPQVFLGRGGVMEYNKKAIDALAYMDNETTVLSMNDSLAVAAKKFKFIPSARPYIFRKLIFSSNAVRLILSRRPDVIFCGHVNFSCLCALFKFIFNIPYYVFTYGIDVWDVGMVNAFGLRNADKILATSRSVRMKMLNNVPDLETEKITILPCAVDEKVFRPAQKPECLRKRLGIGSEDKVVLTVARLSKTEKRKGYYNVLDALPAVRRQIPNVKYILAGCGDDVENIRDRIEKNGLKDAVMLPGLIDDAEIADYYNLCDLFIMPSKKEGFGIVFLEALACGKVVIAGNTDGSRDPLLDGKLGILVDPDDVRQIQEAMIKALKKDIEPRLLDGDYLRRSVIEEYGVDRFRARLRDILNN